MPDWNELGKYRENNRIEAKKAQGGLPSSLWNTYSAFANTQGGVILLGVVEQNDKTLHAVGVPDPEKLVKEFWDTVNNRQKVSVSMLLEKHVRIENVDGKSIVVIEVLRADRVLRPVFLNKNPLAGTYRRNGEGDYLCTPEAVRAMMRDSGEKTQDMLVMDSMSLEVLDYESLRHYRNRMKVTRPGHVWESLEDVEFLQKLGAIGVGEDEKLHPTAATRPSTRHCARLWRTACRTQIFTASVDWSSAITLMTLFLKTPAASALNSARHSAAAFPLPGTR
jgi:predicted HTH transcriptional regulator